MFYSAKAPLNSNRDTLNSSCRFTAEWHGVNTLARYSPSSSPADLHRKIGFSEAGVPTWQQREADKYALLLGSNSAAESSRACCLPSTFTSSAVTLGSFLKAETRFRMHTFVLYDIV